MGADRLALMPRFFMPVSTHLDHRFSRYLIIHSATPPTASESP